MGYQVTPSTNALEQMVFFSWLQHCIRFAAVEQMVQEDVTDPEVLLLHAEPGQEKCSVSEVEHDRQISQTL